MRGIHRKFYHLVVLEQSYDDLLLECYKVSRFTNGGAPIERLINLPLNELFNEIKVVNKAAEQEKMIIDAAKK